MKRLTQELGHLPKPSLSNFNLSTRRYIYYSRDQLTNKLSTMALRRPPTRIELKADDVEEYDKVSNGQQWFIILYSLSKDLHVVHPVFCICLPANITSWFILCHSILLTHIHMLYITILYTPKDYERTSSSCRGASSAREDITTIETGIWFFGFYNSIIVIIIYVITKKEETIGCG